jgi:tetratricopeptide (TPR) repeat protein
MGMISTCEANGDSLMLAQCMMRLGRIEGGSGGHSAAETNFTRALGIYEAAGNVNQAMVAARNIGLARWKQKRLEAAAEILEKTYERAKAENSPRTSLLILNDLSMLYTSLNQPEEAIRHDRAADDLLLSMAEDITAGKLEDHLNLDFWLLYKQRYIGKPSYELEMFDGFFSYLALSPEE